MPATSESFELEEFLRETASILDCRPTITEFGVSRTLSVELNRRVVEVATNGPMLWLITDLDWPAFPTDGTIISWAPEKSLLRTKLLEGAGRAHTTGNVDFDHAYLIHGPSVDVFGELDAEVVRLLLATQDLRPNLTGLWISHDPIKMCGRPHIRCEPSLTGDPCSSAYVELGTERYKPEYAARWAEEVAVLAGSLDAIVDPGGGE